MTPAPDFILEIRKMIGHHPLWLPGITAVITRGDGDVLLVKRSDNGSWTPVMGIVDPGEEPAFAAAREALEETGVVIAVDRLAATRVSPEFEFENGDRSAFLDLTFACTWMSGEAYVADEESTEVRWWPRDELPPLPDYLVDRIEAALSGECEARFASPTPRPPAAVETLRPDRPVLGVDACPAGWVGVLLGPEGRPTVHVAGSIAALLSLVRETAVPSVVAIDIPIGLPDHGGRRADAEARRELVGKGSSVFSTLTRAAYVAETYEQARSANLAATEGAAGGPTSASAQAYALGPKILEVDQWVRSEPGAVVIEVHPELSFARMTGSPVLVRKKDEEGARVRREALLSQGLRAPAWFRGSGFAEDDLLDACAAVWSAARHDRGVSESFPAQPETFSDGIAAAIRV